MIHGASKDPVLIKKIPLSIWKLKDEIASMVQKKIEAGEVPDPKLIEKEYSDAKGEDAIIVSEDVIIPGSTILSEVTMEKIHFFSKEPLTIGQAVVLRFNVPQPFIVNIEILVCRTYNMKSRIISENKLGHRVIAKYTFVQEEEKEKLRKFITSIEPDELREARASKQKEAAPDEASAGE